MKKCKKTTIISVILSLITILLGVLYASSSYMIAYSLSPEHNRENEGNAYELLFNRMPDMKPWVDSLRSKQLLRDTFVLMPTGERHHALYLRGDSACGRTAIIVHGYKDCAVTYLYLGRMYHRDFGFNVLLPDLHAHGKSEGNDIQMGWKERLDVRHWVSVSDSLFCDSVHEPKVIVHGVSMGAATTMNLSGEVLPNSVCAFVADCGYTSVWDEFATQMRQQFSLPEFPVMYTTSLLCKIRNGWSFSEASPLRQVAKSKLPMLFIHGDSDTFVPTWMVHKLYEAKPEPKQLWIVPNTAHALSFRNYPADYTIKVGDFLAKYKLSRPVDVYMR